MDGIDYRKAIWIILKEFKEDKEMTLDEATDEILAVPVPEEGKVTLNKKDKSVVRKLTKEEYRKKVREILKGYRYELSYIYPYSVFIF